VNDNAPKFARGVRLRVENEETAYLLVPEGVVELSDSARAILELVDGERRIDEIAAELSARYDARLEQLRDDVRALCGALMQRGFLQ
jgi:pyrroloquinoline quinone biosynthesis protein D